MMPGPPQNYRSRLHYPAHSALWQEPIPPDDATPFTQPTRALYIGAGGVLVIVDPFNHEVTYNPADGEQLPIAAVKVKATGTTASQIVGWW